MTLRHSDPISWTDIIWDALASHRETCIPEGDPEYDAEWSDICTAMAWLCEAAGIPTGADSGESFHE